MGIRDFFRAKSDRTETLQLQDLKNLREKVQRKLERMPIYDSGFKFKLCNRYLWDGAKLMTISIFRDRQEEICGAFDVLFFQAGEAILAEKDPKKVEELIDFYRETENIENDYCSRNYYWNRVWCFEPGPVKFKDLEELTKLEEKYAKYNGGKGLKALDKEKTQLMKEMALEEAQLMEEHKARSDEARLREILQKAKQGQSGRPDLGDGPGRDCKGFSRLEITKRTNKKGR